VNTGKSIRDFRSERSDRMYAFAGRSSDRYERT
jgi:hypothetical protein